MQRAKVKGIDGEVFIDPKQTRPGTIIYREFDGSDKRILRVLHDVISEVCPATFEEWANGFRVNNNPQPDIHHWVRMIACYKHFAKAAGLTRHQKCDIYSVVITYFTNGPEYILQTLNLATVSREQIMEMVKHIDAEVWLSDHEELVNTAWGR